MCRKILKTLFSALFQSGSALRLSAASSIGLAIGTLQFLSFPIPIILVLSIVFHLNIASLFIGFFIGILLPFSGLNELFGITDGYIPIYTLLEGLGTAILMFVLFKILYSWILKGRPHSSKASFVFKEPSGTRWAFTKMFLIVFLIAVFIAASIYTIRLNIDPLLPDLGLDNLTGGYNINKLNINSQSVNGHDISNRTIGGGEYKIFAFYDGWDEKSLVSLKDNIANIDFLIPDWYHLSNDMTLKSNVQTAVDELASDSNVRIIPLFNNLYDDNWNEEALHSLLNSTAIRSEVIQELYKQIKENNYAGINVDFEGIIEEDRDLFTSFMSELYAKFHPDNLIVTLNIKPQDDSYNYSELFKTVDYGILSLYDENHEEDGANPIASAPWVDQALKSINAPDGKLVVSLGNYGCDWAQNNKIPYDVITFNEVTDLAENTSATVFWDNASQNPYLKYNDENEEHTIWFLDGSTFFNQLKNSLNYGIEGVALWRLGSEDSSIWDTLKGLKTGELSPPENLQELKCPNWLDYEGSGEILRIKSTGKNGMRELQISSDGFIQSEKYISYPVQFKTKRYGSSDDKKIAITFDDGPDSKYTPLILDILKQYNIKATFFIIGENASISPEIVKRIYLEGHEIGNHTFTHQDTTKTAPIFNRWELNLTQRLIQSLTGHSTVLFRPPYNDDRQIVTVTDLIPTLEIQNMGYTLTSQRIDPLDWKASSSEEIINNIKHQLSSGNIILLHDSGGDRQNTVEALPFIIEELQREGYTFVTVSDLLGKSRNEVMPPVTINDKVLSNYDNLVFHTLKGLHDFVSILFEVTIVLGSARFLLLIIFTARQLRKKKNIASVEDYHPKVSIIIPAFNESKVIGKTIKAALMSDYSDIELIVVDDGSTDNTDIEVKKSFKNYGGIEFSSIKDSSKDSLVFRKFAKSSQGKPNYEGGKTILPRSRVMKLIVKDNGGKASAINEGIKEARGEIIVAIDSDTIIDYRAVSNMVGYFKDPNVAAVSGNVKVGNIHNILTQWQHIEYVTGFNLERRAFDALNCVTVVPGAMGAWRKSAVIEAGYYKEDTLAEDTDITITLLQKGCRIYYAERACAFTEAPDNIKSFLKQRFRWIFGILQCMWKHKEVFFNTKNKKLGFIALPNMLLFQYTFHLLAPIVDIYFIFGLLGHERLKSIIFYLVFLAVDYAAAIYAFYLEQDNIKPLIWLFIQRVIYRFLMVFIVYKSILAALKGEVVGWNKLDRTGNVKVILYVEEDG